jgi:putative ABC transport system ATP-binding protein
VSTQTGTAELLRLTGVSKTYRRGSQELCVLREANLHVRAGEVVCVLATGGKGKTALLRIAAGFESADEGVVSFEGQDLAECSDAQLSRLRGEKIAWAGKRGPRTGVQMFDYIANPMLARRGEGAQSGNWIQRWQQSRAYGRTVEERVRAALARVGAAGCAEQYWETMSDCERALTELAHAIAAEPALVLLDDVTDNLAGIERKDFISLVRAISGEMNFGVLMSVSDGNATILSDRIMTLSGGRLTETPQRPATAKPPPSGGKVLEFPRVGSDPLEAGHASSS